MSDRNRDDDNRGRGFAGMDEDEQREIARKGGEAVTVNTWQKLVARVVRHLLNLVVIMMTTIIVGVDAAVSRAVHRVDAAQKMIAAVVVVGHRAVRKVGAVVWMMTIIVAVQAAVAVVADVAQKMIVADVVAAKSHTANKLGTCS